MIIIRLFTYVYGGILKKFNNVIKGTLILTTAGILSKILGFFYRIYLSRCIGAAGMGLFQIVMPAAGIVFAICSSGIQTAISKFCCDKKNDFLWLISGLLLSIPTSLILTFIVYTNADFIATRFILNEACSSLLKILSLSFPFAAFHNCINGFYFAKKKTAIPAFSQLFEQIIRFCAVYMSPSMLLTEMPLYCVQYTVICSVKLPHFYIVLVPFFIHL